MRRGTAFGAFGMVMVSTPSLRISVDAVGVDGGGQREPAEKRAVAAFDAMVLLAGHARRRPLSLELDVTVEEPDLEILAGEPGQFGGEHVSIGRLVQVDRWRPARVTGLGEPVDPLLQGEQIAQRIPAREGHGGS